MDKKTRSREEWEEKTKCEILEIKFLFHFYLFSVDNSIGYLHGDHPMKPYFETIKYLPLPKEVRLGFSEIHDIGLFAKEKIERGRNFRHLSFRNRKKII